MVSVLLTNAIFQVKILQHRYGGQMPGRRSVPREPTAFGRLLLAHIADAGFTVRSFAKRVEVTHGYISQVAYGRRPMAVDSLAVWILALDLTGAAKERFRDEALIASSHEQVRDLIRELQARVRRLEAAR